MPCEANASGRSAQLDVVLLRDIFQSIVERLVGHLDAGAIGALDLQLLQHQPIEHLLAQDVLRRQVDLLRANAARR